MAVKTYQTNDKLIVRINKQFHTFDSFWYFVGFYIRMHDRKKRFGNYKLVKNYGERIKSYIIQECKMNILILIIVIIFHVL